MLIVPQASIITTLWQSTKSGCTLQWYTGKHLDQEVGPWQFSSKRGMIHSWLVLTQLFMILKYTVFFSDRKRYRLKTLDEYYHIRANITSKSIAQEILEQSKPKATPADRSWRLVMVLVMFLLITWTCLIISMLTGDSIYGKTTNFNALFCWPERLSFSAT